MAIESQASVAPPGATADLVSIWFLTSWTHLVWAVFTAVVTVALLPLVVNLPLAVLSGQAGAWFYKE